MSNDFKLWSYQQKVEWLLEQVKKGTVDVEELTSQVETNKDNIETNTGDISNLKEADKTLDERIKTLEEAPAPTGGVEIINVTIGEYSEATHYYALTISAEDKAKVLANPQNYVLAFEEPDQHSTYDYASYYTKYPDNMYIYRWTRTVAASGDARQPLTAVVEYQFAISENADMFSSITFEVPTSSTKETITCGVASANELDLTKNQLVEIYTNPEKYDIKVVDNSYTVYLHYDGFASGTVFFSGTKPVSGASTKATFSITKIMSILTQHYNY